jgi:hypothetical protein
MGQTAPAGLFFAIYSVAGFQRHPHIPAWRSAFAGMTAS